MIINYLRVKKQTKNKNEKKFCFQSERNKGLFIGF
nr:MAG TPA: hypothetical protein [Caudoviricetes sp.]